MQALVTSGFHKVSTTNKAWYQVSITSHNVISEVVQ